VYINEAMKQCQDACKMDDNSFKRSTTLYVVGPTYRLCCHQFYISSQRSIGLALPQTYGLALVWRVDLSHKGCRVDPISKYQNSFQGQRSRSNVTKLTSHFRTTLRQFL